MSAIEEITSKQRTVVVEDKLGYKVPIKVPVWNPTVANLTLMALGSSAPEIMLSVIETVTTLGKIPGELGPSTIVGSAAFNLLVISGVSIFSVNPDSDNRTEVEIEQDGTPKGVKKIYDVGVFAITTLFSVFAYIWLYICLMERGDEEKGIVTPLESWLTFGYFWCLIIIAYIADKCNSARMAKR